MLPRKATFRSINNLRCARQKVLAAQTALREPPNEVKSRIDDLESEIRRLGKVEQNWIPSIRQSNEARIRLATAHEELLRALTSK